MYDFRPLTILTRVATIMLCVQMATELVVALLMLYFSRSIEDLDSVLAGYLDYLLIANFLVLILCFIVVGRWIYRASANAHALSYEMEISPGWAVGWYFIPFANLFKPYQAMREIWMVSHHRVHGGDVPTPPLLIGWWALWLINGFIGNNSFRIGMEDTNGDMLSTSAMLDLAVAGLNVPLCLILITIIRRIDRAQLTTPYEETFG